MIRLAGYDNIHCLFLNEGLGDHEQPLPGKQIGRLGKALRQVSMLISQGNITVCEELAWPFASFIDTFKKDWIYDRGKLQAFLDEHFRPGSLRRGGTRLPDRGIQRILPHTI